MGPKMLEVKSRVFVFIFVLSNVFVTISGEELDDKELILDNVQLVFRHGARTAEPLESKMIDIENSKIFEPWGGDGQLIDSGMRQMHHLGKYLRKQYGKSFGDYSKKDIYALSTNLNRTVKSLQCVLAGLFLPDRKKSVRDLLEDREIRDFGVQTTPLLRNVLFGSVFSDIFLEEFAGVYNTSEYQKRMKKYSSTINLVKRNTHSHKITTLKISEEAVVRLTYSALASLKAIGVPFPDWCSEEIFEAMKEILSMTWRVATSTPQLKRILAGPLLREILANIESENRRKFYLYSGHDINVAALTGSLEFNLKYPEYGSAIILETWHKAGNDKIKFLRIKGWSGADDDTFALKLKNCEEFCPEDKFKSIIAPLIPSPDELSRWTNSMAQFVFRRLLF